MKPSYLYHAFGVRHQECTKTEYKGNQIFIISRLAKRNYAVQCAKVAKLSVLGAYIEIQGVSLSGIEKRFFA